MASLTILMPAYNAALYLTEAVESLLEQTFQDFELWILDDGSSDQTYLIASQLALKDKRIRVFTHQQNKGRIVTVNAKVHAVQSPFFTVTDADDISLPDRLAKQIQCLQSDPSLMMCGTSYAAINAAGYLVREMRLLSDLNALRARSLHQSPFMGPTTIMRREVLLDFPEFYRSYCGEQMADADLATRILDKHAATNLTEILYLYRILPDSITRKNITPRSLNLHRLIGYLSHQRRTKGKDYLEEGDIAGADQWMKELLIDYERNNSLLHRHQAFFYLYWGQHTLAIKAITKAINTQSLQWKNIFGFAFIVLKSLLRVMSKVFTRTYYKSKMKI